MGGHVKKAAIPKPEREALGEITPWEDKSLLYNVPSLSELITAALAN